MKVVGKTSCLLSQPVEPHLIVAASAICEVVNHRANNQQCYSARLRHASGGHKRAFVSLDKPQLLESLSILPCQTDCPSVRLSPAGPPPTSALLLLVMSSPPLLSRSLTRCASLLLPASLVLDHHDMDFVANNNHSQNPAERVSTCLNESHTWGLLLLDVCRTPM